MKFCTSCGAQIADNQTFCAKCGKPINNTQNARPAQYNAPAQTAAAASVPAAPETFGKKSGLAKASKALGILGFFFGITYSILALVFSVCSKTDTDGIETKDAKVGRICAIVNICVKVAITVIAIIVWMALFFTLMARFGGDIHEFVPEFLVGEIRKKLVEKGDKESTR